TYRDDFGIGESAAGVLSGSFAAGTLVMALPAGWLAARFGSRRTVIAGLVGIGIFSPTFGFADELWLLDLSRFLQGASGAMMWAGAMSWVILASPKEHRGQVIGTVIAAAVVGELLGAPLGAVAHEVGTEIVFGSVFFLAAGLIVVAMSLPPTAETNSQPIREAVTILRRSAVPKAVLILAGPSLAFGLVIVLAPLHMDDLGASPFLIAAAFAAGSVIEAVIGPLIGRYSDRVGRIAPYLGGLGVLSISVVAIGLFNLLPLIVVAVVMVAFGAGLAFTPASSLVADTAAMSGLKQGYASGASNVAWGGGQMVGAAGGGFLASATGYLVPCLLTAGVLFVIALVARGVVPASPGILADGEIAENEV
ncbi:MAG: MFS transporter, partial [Actinomycetota bacterium]|nr:MFS transporter [Actinomycetota bacterium]